MHRTIRTIAPVAVGAALLLGACSDDGGTAGGSSPQVNSDGEIVEPGDVDPVDVLSCEEVLSVAQVAQITGLPIDHCFSAGDVFLTADESQGLEIVVKVFADDAQARAEYDDERLSDTTVTGNGWEASDSRLGSWDAVMGNRYVSIGTILLPDDDEDAVITATLDAIAAT